MRRAAVLFAVLALILTLTLIRSTGPSPKPRSAPTSEFSAERAILDLRQILGGDIPHPMGTPAHEAVRERIAAHLRSLGYDTRIQRAYACDPSATCGEVTNVIARLPGQPSGDAVLLAAHYDSVGAGPGASDDGTGVATMLEVARAIRTEHFRNPIVILIDDGEEAGLLGAEGFISDATASQPIAAVINVDNRGTSGTSYLFETSRKNRWLIDLAADAIHRPAASSLFFSIYELMPNDTDMTVFKRAGKGGVNFACIGQVGHYHTPLDNIENLTPSTIQHHGDNVLGMTRALGNADLTKRSNDNATYFDVLSLRLLWWPEPWTIPIAVIVLVMLLVAAALRIREGETRVRSIAAGVLSFFLSIAVAGAIGAAATWIMSLRAEGLKWVAYPLPSVAAAWLIGIGSAILMAKLLGKKAGFEGLFLGHALCWIILALVVAVVLSGGSYLFLVPAIAFALCAIARSTLDLSDTTTAVICASVAAVLHFILGVTLQPALGTPALAGIAALLALVGTTFSPLFAGALGRRTENALSSEESGRRNSKYVLPFALFAAAAVCVVIELLHPPYDQSHPRRANISYVATADRAYWEPDIRLRGVNGAYRDLYEWYREPLHDFVIDAPRVPLPPPELQVISDSRGGKRVLTVDIRSPRGAQRTALTFHTEATVEGIRVNGVAPPPGRTVDYLATGWHRVVVRGSSARIEITMRGTRPIDAVTTDYSYGLPPQGATLQRIRDAMNAVPSGEGDLTIVLSRTRM